MGELERGSPPFINKIWFPEWRYRLGGMRRLIFPLTCSFVLHVALVFLLSFGVGKSPDDFVFGWPHGAVRLPKVTITPIGSASSGVVASRLAAQLPIDQGATLPFDDEGRKESRISEVRQQEVGIVPFSADYFYTTDQLTTRPRPLTDASLLSPEITAIGGSGRIVLTLKISEAGDVVDVSQDSSNLPEVFSNVAISAFRQLRFNPGEINGQKVRTVMKVEILYSDPMLQ